VTPALVGTLAHWHTGTLAQHKQTNDGKGRKQLLQEEEGEQEQEQEQELEEEEMEKEEE
jgi:hypothetical protein